MGRVGGFWDLGFGIWDLGFGFWAPSARFAGTSPLEGEDFGFWGREEGLGFLGARLRESPPRGEAEALDVTVLGR